MGQIVSLGNEEARLPPSRKVCDVLGIVRVAGLCERTTEAVRKWHRSKTSGGTGGLIPAEFQARLLKASDENGLGLTADDLIAEPIL